MEIVSLVSATLTLAGLVLAIVEARRARVASISAENAAKAARDASLRSAAVLDLSATIKALSEIKSLHRAAALEVLPARYEALRHSLTAMRQVRLFSETDVQKSMQSLITRLAGIERIIDQGVTVEDFKSQVPRINAQITRAMDDMQAVMVVVAHQGVKL
ncbi:hypothetical protein [Luteimonas deserti]|uniref:Chemotaxis protein n=1 Tax=Luteimonas deserti TaxID=2752306 RepID=A0A7Z0QPX0_9GAMM|nr:hypothetical protein [Luteimonas deserti]NYZ61801.1 hypothetical protein [Luteimonas deserti]